MLIDRVLVGLGVVVITAGAALGWAGASEMRGDEGVAQARASDEAAPVFGPFALPAKPGLGTAGLWDNPWWAAPWQSSWGELSGAGLGRTPDAGTDASGSGSGDYVDDAERADAGASAAGRVLAAGLEPVVAKAVRAEPGVGDFAAAYARAGEGAGESPAETEGAKESERSGARMRTAAPAAALAAAAKPSDDNLRAAAPRRVPVAAPSATKIVKQTFTYGPYERNEMDVYRTAATVADVGQRLPTVVFVHGGSWVKGGKEHWTEIVKPFVQAGYTAVAINYRLATDAAWPAQRTDVVAAVQALKDNAARYNVDPDRVVLVGSSAGGQLVAAAGTWEEAPNLVRGFVSLSGALDMFKLVAAATVGKAQETLARHVTEEFLRCLPQDCGARYDDATPARHLDPADAPSLLVASEGDWVSPDGARDFSIASNNVGVPSDFWAISGREHGRNMWPAISQRVLDWVATTLRAS